MRQRKKNKIEKFITSSRKTTFPPKPAPQPNPSEINEALTFTPSFIKYILENLRLQNVRGKMFFKFDFSPGISA